VENPIRVKGVRAVEKPARYFPESVLAAFVAAILFCRVDDHSPATIEIK